MEFGTKRLLGELKKVRKAVRKGRGDDPLLGYRSIDAAFWWYFACVDFFVSGTE
jgi:hypothetical protein